MIRIIVVLFMNKDTDTYTKLPINCRGVSSIFNYHTHDELMRLLSNTRTLISYPKLPVFTQWNRFVYENRKKCFCLMAYITAINGFIRKKKNCASYEKKKPSVLLIKCRLPYIWEYRLLITHLFVSSSLSLSCLFPSLMYKKYESFRKLFL